jgi:hypothetical protein
MEPMTVPIRSIARGGFAFIALLLYVVMSSAHAQGPLAAPKGKVVLVITGNVTNKNAETGAAFDMAMLEALPKATIMTTTPWTKGVRNFEGVSITTLMAAAGASGQTIKAVALNDYAFSFPAADAEKYKVIVAYAQDGKAMSVREKGPLWIIYPLDAHKEIRNIEYHSRMVWQLKELQIK